MLVPAFSSFPRLFSKGLFLGVVESWGFIREIEVFTDNKTDATQNVKLGVGKTESRVFNPLPNKPWFLHVCNSSLLKTLWEKEKLLVMSNFSFSHSVFYLFGELSAISVKFEIVVCKHFEFGRV